jgi:hypothetical protein
MSSETAGYVETLLGDAERWSSSMQWLASMTVLVNFKWTTGTCLPVRVRLTGKLSVKAEDVAFFDLFEKLENPLP